MKPAEHARAATHDPRSTRFRLTPRQKEVFALLCQGLTNKHICRRLNIAQPTVKAHVSAILRALGVSNRVEAVLWAIHARVDYDPVQRQAG
jgi:DNA-binding NarL/FixJ family response regulator